MGYRGEKLGYFSRKAEAWAEKAAKNAWKEGREEGQRELLVRSLEGRFGALDEAQLRRILDADAKTFEHLFERSLGTTSLADVFD